MRMLFCLFYLIFTSVAVADVVDYQYCSAHETDCTATAGCYFDGEDCLPCPQNSYCRANSQSPISCSQGTQGKYTLTNSVGATDQSECYRAVTCNKNPSGTMNCKVHASANSDDEGEWENVGNTTGCSGTNYHLLWDGVSNVRCYANQWNCNRFNYSIQTEPIQAYPNWWVVTDCRDEGGLSVDGVATWNAQQQKWNISACRFDTSAYQGGCLLLSYRDVVPDALGYYRSVDAHCYTRNLILKPYESHIVDMDDTIIYNIADGTYECLSCSAGYVVDLQADLQSCGQVWVQDQHASGGGYYEYRCEFNSCNDTMGETDAVCKCTPTVKGTYVEQGDCDWSDLIGDRFSASQVGDRCRVEACPFGKTTDSVGSTSMDACHYTTDTQFCDAGGCFSLSDIQDWTPVP